MHAFIIIIIYIFALLTDLQICSFRETQAKQHVLHGLYFGHLKNFNLISHGVPCKIAIHQYSYNIYTYRIAGNFRKPKFSENS